MTKEVQLVGSTRELQDLYTGPERELTVDKSNWNLRLHDGVTQGGWTFLNRDNSDVRYQARSPELNGLLGFTPQEKGILVRLGPADYRLRMIKVNTGNLSIVNGNGYDGNPLIALANVITTDHQIDGNWVFSQPIMADGGVVGNLTGDSTGIHTGDVVGNVTGNFEGDSHGNHTGTHTGDVDVRDGTILFAPGQIPLEALGSDVITELLRLASPIGGIIAWSGAIADVPDHWVLCDGDNGTPDLRDRFIIGAGGAMAPDEFGGASSLQPTFTIGAGGDHAHAVNVDGHVLTESEIPSHRHLGGATHSSAAIYAFGTAPAVPTTGRRIDGNGGTGTIVGYTTYAGGGGAHSHTGNSVAGGSHTHPATSDQIDYLPPYYALAYIMKVS